jgi:alpha-tubulin suppressor-like RCC1 family protein
VSRRRVSGLLLLLPFGSAACGASESFDPPPVDAPFTTITVGALHSCATTATARVYCWGWNRDGELGDGSRTDRVVPVRVAGDGGIAAVTGGGGHSCAVDSAGVATCWGFNLSGQLGVAEGGGGANVPRSAIPVDVAGGLTLTAIEAGGAFTCGVAADSTAWCWGWGAQGQVGDGARVDRRTPVAAGGGLRLIAVSAGARHTCALAADSTAWCWGDNGAGQLGNGTVTDTTLPVAVSSGRKFIAVSAGYDHTCGLEAIGDIYCWGANTVGQLGDTSVSQTRTPSRVLGGQAFISLTAGAAHTCGTTISGAGYCWGGNANGQLGSQSTSFCATPAGSQPCTRIPTLIVGGMTFQMISAGTQHSCGLTTEAVAFCWGLNDHGQLGDGSTTSGATPVRVAKQAGP